MSLSTKILVALGSLVLISVLAFIVYEQHQMSVQQNAIQQQVVTQKQLADNITRAMSDWTTKADLQQYAKDNNLNLQVIQDNLDKLNATISAINISVAKSNGQIATNIGSTTTIKDPVTQKPVTVVCDGKEINCPNQDPYGYQSNEQVLQLNEKFSTLSIPFGNVTFNAANQAPWSIDIAPRQYKSSTTLATDENQRTFAYNTFTINVNNKDYEIPISSSEIKQVYPGPRFHLWNPMLYLGVNGGVNLNSVNWSGGANLSLQIMSYGKYKIQPDWSILQIGLGFDAVSKQPNLLLSPFAYNVGQHIPLMSNLYVGPVFGWNFNNNWVVLGGITVGL